MTDPLSTLSRLLADLPANHDTPAPGELLDATSNHLMHMDNLAAMARIAPGSLDFVYIDPPFASNATYHHQIKLPGHTIRQQAYTDIWPNGLSSYLEFLIPRLVAIRSVLKPTGSLCVHLDNHGSHYVKLALDAIFGNDRLINEVIWRYGKMSNTRKRFPQNHDTLLIYAVSNDWYFQPLFNEPSEYRTRFLRDLTGNQLLYGTVKHRSDKLIQRRITARTRELGRELQDDDVLFDFDFERKVQDDVFTDISIVRGNAHEGVGYDTQKPQKLLERLITALSPPGGTVADFFCGSGTTGAAAHALDRRWILADRGLAATQTSRLRLDKAPFAFHRDAALDPGAFVADAAGSIIDFRTGELGLSTTDRAAVEQCLQQTPQALIAGRSGNILIDVFGREATLVP